MRTLWLSVVLLVSFGVNSCASSQPAAERSVSLASTNTNQVSSPTSESIATPTSISASTWKTYQNTQAGYSVQYVQDWTVSESTGTGGELITTFTPPNGGPFIIVSVLNSNAVVEEIPDMPNTRCEQITINGLSGRRCFDTVAFSISTTFSSHDKQYTITSSGKHPDQDVYQHFLESFTVIP